MVDSTAGFALKDPREILPDAAQGLPVVRSGTLELSDGQTVEVTPALARFLGRVLAGLRDRKVVHIEFDDVLVTPKRAAELLGVSRPTIYAWQDRGLIPTVQQGTRRMVPIDSVLDRLHNTERIDNILDEIRRDRNGGDSATESQPIPEWVDNEGPVAAALGEIDRARAEAGTKGG